MLLLAEKSGILASFYCTSVSHRVVTAVTLASDTNIGRLIVGSRKREIGGFHSLDSALVMGTRRRVRRAHTAGSLTINNSSRSSSQVESLPSSCCCSRSNELTGDACDKNGREREREWSRRAEEKAADVWDYDESVKCVEWRHASTYESNGKRGETKDMEARAGKKGGKAGRMVCQPTRPTSGRPACRTTDQQCMATA